MDPLSAALVLGGALVGLIAVGVLGWRASRVKLPLGQRPEGAPLGRRARAKREGLCAYCDAPIAPEAARCGACGAPRD